MTNLFDKQIIFVTGKGGVGKTSVSASLAMLAARRGKRVLVCEIDTDPAMARLFGATNKVGFEPVSVGNNIWACNLTGNESMSAFIRRFVPSTRVADLILGNKVAQIFFESAPSVLETVILDQLATHADSKKFDTIVVDMPASGHAVTLLKIPRAMSKMVAVGELAEHIRNMAKIIADPKRSELVVVAIPEEMSVNETIELWAKLKAEVEVRTNYVVVNSIRSPDVREEDLSLLRELSEASGAQVAFASVRDAASLGHYWTIEDRANVDRLRKAVSAKLVEIPFRFRKQSDAALTTTMADDLQGQL